MSSHDSLMSNFAATLDSAERLLSRVELATSKIIDAFSNSKYVFLDVSVGFRILFLLHLLGLASLLQLMDCIPAKRSNGVRFCQQFVYRMWKMEFLLPDGLAPVDFAGSILPSGRSRGHLPVRHPTRT